MPSKFSHIRTFFLVFCLSLTLVFASTASPPFAFAKKQTTAAQNKKQDAAQTAKAPEKKDAAGKITAPPKQNKATVKGSAQKKQQQAVKAKPASSKKNIQNKGRKQTLATSKGKSNKKAKAAAKQPIHRYKGVIAFDASTNKTLFSDQANNQIAPASLTKIISMHVALDAMKARNIPEETLVRISSKAANTGGSRMGLRTNDMVTLNSLLMGMAVASGNDASVAVAEFIAGSEEKFVIAMNKKAQALGMKNSVFKNAHGLPAEGQKTTAADMLALSRSYLKTYPQNLAKYHNRTELTYKGRVRRNANPLLDSYPGGDGLKTGFVNASGYNLIATAKQDNKRIIVVLLGCPTRKVREKEINAMLTQAFSAKPALPSKQDVQRVASLK